MTKSSVTQNILGAPVPDLLNEDGKLIDAGQIIIAQKLQQRKNDIYVMMVSWGIVSLPRYITTVSTVTVTAVTYLGFEYRSVHEGDRRGLTVKPTAKHVEECLDIVQLQNAKAVMTALTEQKSLNLHDKTTVCDQVQHSLFTAGVRPDLMFATKCLSYKLASPTLADLTRAKKVLRYLKGTRELNLNLTIPALKPNDLNKTLKHVTGYSDADWAGDPVTRKSTSCTLCYVDQFLLTSECPGQGTVALSSGESELYALYPERDWTIIPDTRENRQQHSTRSGNETRSKSQDETHSHEIPIHSRFGISETSDDVISQD